MATNNRNGNGTGHNIDSAKSTDKKNLKLKDWEYWKLSALIKEKENSELNIKLVEKDAELSGLKKRINELEKFIYLNKISLLKQKLQGSDRDLVQFRTNVAQRLNVESLDKYIVDTETFELTHEGEI